MQALLSLSLCMFVLLQDEGGRVAVVSPPPPPQPLLWQLPAHSPVSQILLRFRHGDTHRHVHTHTLFQLSTHTHAAEWRATETAQGLSRSHRGGAPSHSLDSVPAQQYLNICTIFTYTRTKFTDMHAKLQRRCTRAHKQKNIICIRLSSCIRTHCVRKWFLAACVIALALTGFQMRPDI